MELATPEFPIAARGGLAANLLPDLPALARARKIAQLLLPLGLPRGTAFLLRTRKAVLRRELGPGRPLPMQREYLGL
ncbi:MAG: hypothetical protein CL938_02515 [Deltaproteobacteria bacterium]|nr:hypothetical protein [Deltaproteobacteria bacterium]